jgi:hypothetical protein
MSKGLCNILNRIIEEKINEISVDDLTAIYTDARQLTERDYYRYSESGPMKLNLPEALMVIGFGFLRSRLSYFEYLCASKVASMRIMSLSFIYALSNHGIIDEDEEFDLENQRLRFNCWQEKDNTY